MSTRACSTGACARASCWCCPCSLAPGDPRRTSDRLAVPVRQVHHGGRGDDPARAGRSSVGLLGIILVKVLAPGFYAQQNIRTPVKIALFTLVSTQLMNLAFIGRFSMPAWPVHRPGRLPECRPALLATAQAASVPAATGLGEVPGQAGGRGAGDVGGAAGHDALAAGLGAGRHAGAIPRLGLLVVAGLPGLFRYARAAGFRLRDFSRRAAVKRVRAGGGIMPFCLLSGARYAYNRPLSEQ